MDSLNTPHMIAKEVESYLHTNCHLFVARSCIRWNKSVIWSASYILIVNVPSVDAGAGELRVTLDAASQRESATPCGEGVSSHPTSGNSTKLESPQMKASTNEIFVPFNELLTKCEKLQRQAICNLLMKAGKRFECSCEKNMSLRTHGHTHTCM